MSAGRQRLNSQSAVSQSQARNQPVVKLRPGISAPRIHSSIDAGRGSAMLQNEIVLGIRTKALGGNGPVSKPAKANGPVRKGLQSVDLKDNSPIRTAQVLVPELTKKASLSETAFTIKATKISPATDSKSMNGEHSTSRIASMESFLDILHRCLASSRRANSIG